MTWVAALYILVTFTWPDDAMTVVLIVWWWVNNCFFSFFLSIEWDGKWLRKLKLRIRTVSSTTKGQAIGILGKAAAIYVLGLTKTIETRIEHLLLLVMAKGGMCLCMWRCWPLNIWSFHTSIICAVNELKKIKKLTNAHKWTQYKYSCVFN